MSSVAPSSETSPAGLERLAPGWRRSLGAEVSKNYRRFSDNGFFARYLAGDNILDIGYKGYRPGAMPILPHAVGVDLDYPGYDGKSLPFADESQDAVFSSHTLEHVADYRGAIAEWFRVLRIGGFLIITVPHQFLYERKLLPPSRFNQDHKRFYTAASLLLEIEEALDPFSYRIRFPEDNDAGFDYAVPPRRHATGCYETIIVLERIPRPDYADEVLTAKERKPANHFHRPPSPRGGPEGPVMTIAAIPVETRKIVALKLDHRGDFIMAKPAMAELRARFPSAHLTLICGSWNVPDAQRLDIFDEILAFDFFGERGTLDPRRPAEIVAAFLRCIDGCKFDLAIDFRVDPDTRQFLPLIDADQRAGFGTTDRFPFLDIALPYVNPTVYRPGYPIDAGHFRASLGTVDHEIVWRGWSYITRQSECLLCGPFIDLAPGSYTIDLGLFARLLPFSVGVAVYADRGREIVKPWWPFRVKQRAAITFDLHLREAKNIEFRIYSREYRFVRSFRFDGCRIARHGEWHGPHQRELMYALVSVIGLRMLSPYKICELTP
ncbi:MAG TPA: methyltransferase domain-containing protein [Stellaceae bacterium]|nr:methyltransferase domain-containing protein [Stellaceae bacterium]